MRRSFSLLSIAVLIIGVSISAAAQTYTYSDLYSFQNNGTDPYFPSALIINGSGTLFGTTIYGGTNNQGTVFTVTPKGALNVLYTFNGNDSYDAVSPISLVKDSKGNLYGDTSYFARSYVGELFELVRGTRGNYTFKQLYVASGTPAQLIMNGVGDVFWINCAYAGDSSCSTNSTLNEVSGGGNNVLYSFGDVAFVSSSNLLRDRSGDIYGSQGGDDVVNFGLIYKWSPTSGYSVVHTFNATDGAYPVALRQDSKGNIYGTTGGGGAQNFGTVFKISSTGAFSTLYNFCSQPNCSDGEYPIGPLTLDSAGNLYGVTVTNIFKLTPGGVETTIYNNGSVLIGSGLVVDKAGNLYGTTQNGGSAGRGSVYKLTLQ